MKIIILFLILSLPQSYATYLNVNGGEDFIIETIEEQVVISKERGLLVQFKAEITIINNQIYDNTDSIIFYFVPYFNSKENVENYTYSIRWRTEVSVPFNADKDANYNNINNLETDYEYNVSLKGLEGYNSLVFSANFTLADRIKRQREGRYTFFYISRTDAKNYYLSFNFPNKYDVTFYPEAARQRPNTQNTKYQISKKSLIQLGA